MLSILRFIYTTLRHSSLRARFQSAPGPWVRSSGACSASRHYRLYTQDDKTDLSVSIIILSYRPDPYYCALEPRPEAQSRTD